MVVRLWQTLSQRLLQSVVSVLLGLLFKVLVLPYYFPYYQKYLLEVHFPSGILMGGGASCTLGNLLLSESCFHL